MKHLIIKIVSHSQPHNILNFIFKVSSFFCVNSGCSETNNYNTDVKTDDIASLINTTITVTGTTPETNNSITRVTTDYIVNIESATDMAVIEIKLFLYLDSFCMHLILI